MTLGVMSYDTQALVRGKRGFPLSRTAWHCHFLWQKYKRISMNDVIKNTQETPEQLLTDRNAIIDLLHIGYLEACEKQNSGIVERTISTVSGEVCDMLSARYQLPLPYVPKVIRYITSVISAYRIVQAITSLVSSEASSDNEWLPLQSQWKHCNKILADLVDGKIKLPLPENEIILTDDKEEASFHVIAPSKTFDFSRF